MKRLPSLFISHGSPTFALEPGRLGPALTELGTTLPTPKAVLVVSPHWRELAAEVSVTPQPETVHDFRGFPEEMYTLQYPAAGHPALAQRAVDLLAQAGWSTKANTEHGMDHGAWVPLMHLYPQAQVPVFQVVMPTDLDQESAWRLGEALAPLADEGVLIIGSGSLTHNLSEVRFGSTQEAIYVEAFTDWVGGAAERGDADALRRALSDAPHAMRAHPTHEHFLPLLVAAGAAGTPLPKARILHGGIEHRVLAMDAYLFGDAT
ncbi:MAG: class III extradiol ring-cleavage dioxygenase [Brachymonas sp.]|nr:class III extradiol ring-cleavage dioxygenase [Brachymonas sp.]